RGSESAGGSCDLKGRFNVVAVERTSDADPYSVCPQAMESRIKGALNQYDMVIIDLPSLASGPGARAVAQIVDGFLLVVRWGQTESELVQQAIQSAGEAQTKFIGIALNAVDERALR